MQKTAKKTILDFLTQSLTSDQISRLAQDIDPGFDLSRLSGFDATIRIPASVAARCVLDFFPTDKERLHFIAQTLRLEGQGVGGGIISLKGTDRLLNVLEKESWILDRNSRRFVRDQSGGATDDWGYMLAGEEYRLSFASIDIVDSTTLAEQERRENIEYTLREFQNYVRRYTELWNGRLWHWQGDGGTAVFVDASGVRQAVIAVTAILLNLPVFNIRRSTMNGEIRVRIGMHYGTAVFQEDVREIFSNDMRQAQRIEKEAALTNGIAVSGSIMALLDREISVFFELTDDHPISGIQVYRYRRAPGAS